MPIQFNPTTNEPYLRLFPPHQNIILTPARPSDGPFMAEILNSPEVYKNLNGPPFPYTEESWNEWWPIVSSSNKKSLEEYLVVEEARSKGEKGAWVGSGQPVTILREEVEVDGVKSEVIVGEISIRRCLYEEMEEEERKRLKEVNDALEAGNEGIQWAMGFYLSPKVHGRGIMPTALRTLIDSFYIPYLNVHILYGAFYETNLASKRVFEKVGFVFEKMVPGAVELKEERTGVKGKKMGLGVMKWTR